MPLFFHVGFTGTQRGMSVNQINRLAYQLATLAMENEECSEIWFHHGDCIGSDEQASRVAIKMGYKIHLHPPTVQTKRAFCNAHTASPCRPYLDRNHDIVDSCSILIAAPKSNDEELRSGTWATIRYARKVGKLVMILER